MSRQLIFSLILGCVVSFTLGFQIPAHGSSEALEVLQEASHMERRGGAPQQDLNGGLSCYAWRINRDQDVFEKQPLVTSKVDPYFLEATVAGAGVGVDLYDLRESGTLRFVIVDKSAPHSSLATLGLRKIPGTAIKRATLSLNRKENDGSQTTFQLACFKDLSRS